MSIMDFFKPQAPAAAPAPVTPAPATAQPNADGGNTQLPQGTNTPTNPLDAYKKMYDNANSNPEAAPTFSLDPKVIGEVSSKLDFTQGIDPEIMTKATSGDAQALISIINHVGRQSYNSAMSHLPMLTDKFVEQRSQFDLKSVGSKVKSELTNSALAATPSFSHPAVKQELSRIATMMQREHPDASPQEIAASAQKYFSDIYQAITPTQTAQQKQEASGETDWAKYFGS